MPRKISAPTTSVADSDALIELLVRELKSAESYGQPIILERRFQIADAVHVYVVWDRFDGVSEDQRAEIILDAYERAEGTDFRNRITLATGLTVPEAADLGLLPYGVVSARRNDERVTLDEYREAMIQEGASTLASQKHPELRFETLDEAVAAMTRLEQRLPGSFWVVVQEVAK